MTRPFRPRVAALALACGLALTGLLALPAAAVSFDRVDDGVCTYRMQGDIVPGDSARLAAVLQQTRSFSLCLDSGGGSVHEGLTMMRMLLQPDVAVQTHVRNGSFCASACTFVLFAGTDRHAGRQVPARFVWPGGMMGVHAPSLRQPDTTFTAEEIRDAYREGIVVSTWITEALLLTVGQQPLITPWLHRRMLATPAEDMFWLETVADVAFAGVSLGGVTVPAPLSSQQWAQLCTMAYLLGHPLGRDDANALDTRSAASIVSETLSRVAGGPATRTTRTTATGTAVSAAMFPGRRYGTACEAEIPQAAHTLAPHRHPGQFGPLEARFVDYVLTSSADFDIPPSGPPYNDETWRVRIEPWFALNGATLLRDLR